MSNKVKKKQESKATDELLIFGYACKTFDDDEKAIYIDEGNHLIPWMGNSALMIDRYDVRGALYDIDATGHNDNVELSEVEQKEEELCEHERYFALYHDEEATAEREEEESKRLQVELGSQGPDYKQTGFSYNSSHHSNETGVEAPQQAQQGYTPQADDDTFIPPPSLIIPPGMIVPTSIKQHKIIVKTAKFIAKQGTQMEIVLKTKQANNPMFGFLSFDNHLNHYYKHIVVLIRGGKYSESEPPPAADPLPPAVFNPLNVAAPGVSITPKKVQPPQACSYSKLICKIRENQAKSGVSVACTPSRSQSPLVDGSSDTPSEGIADTVSAASTTTIAATSIITSMTSCNTTGDTSNSLLTPLTATATTTTSSTTLASSSGPPSLVTPSTPSSGGVSGPLLPPTSTPNVATATTPATAVKTFVGLVDYPSFNTTNLDYSDTDDSDASLPPVNGLRNGQSHSEKFDKTNNSSANRVNSKQHTSCKDYNKHQNDTNNTSKHSKLKINDDMSKASSHISKKIRKRKDRSVSPKCNNKKQSSGKKRKAVLASLESSQDDVRGVPWPSPSEQLIIDKIACHVVKNGAQFEKTFAGRGDPRFSFLQKSSKLHRYYELKLSLYGEVFGVAKQPRSSAPSISFSIKQHSEPALPPTAFPLETSSSEELDDQLDQRERDRRIAEREERKVWRKVRREQFVKEKKEKDDKERKERDRAERDKRDKERELLRLKELEEQEDASGDEEMYDIFKYAQEQNAAPVARPPKHDNKLRRKKAAHAFLSQLKELAMIGPQLPPEMMMLVITPPPPPSNEHPSSPASSCNTPPPPPHTATDAAPLPPITPPPPSTTTSPPPPTTTPPPPPPPLDRTDSPAVVDLETAPPVGRPSLLAAAVTSLLTNEERLHQLGDSEAGDRKRRRLETKTKTHKSKHRREASRSRSSDRSSRARSVKKKKKKHKHHRHGVKSSSSSRSRKQHKTSSSSSAKKDKKKRSSGKSSRHRHRHHHHHHHRRHRSSSVSSSASSVSSYDSDVSSRSSSVGSSYSSSAEPRRKRKRRVADSQKRDEPAANEDTDSERDEVQVISDSSNVSRASSVVSVRSDVAVAVASVPPQEGIDDVATVSSSLPPSQPLTPRPAPSNSPLTLTLKPTLPATFDLKSSSAMAKITLGLRAKIHALMDKKRPDN